MCKILTFVDWWVKWKIGSLSQQIWLKNTLDRDLPMMKLLLLFNEFFLHLHAFHRNLNFLEQTCAFLHLLTQLSSLTFALFVVAFLILPQLFYFAVAFLFLRGFLFCRDFFILLLHFSFAVTFLFFRGFFIFAFFVLPWLFGFAVTPMGHHRQ